MGSIKEYVEERHEFGREDPGQPSAGIMFVFYEGGEPQGVDFLCPCGCGNTCYTPVIQAGRPKQPRHWFYSPGPTIEPSIRWLSGCKSHFNITGGKVIMHADSG